MLKQRPSTFLLEVYPAQYQIVGLIEALLAILVCPSDLRDGETFAHRNCSITGDIPY